MNFMVNSSLIRLLENKFSLGHKMKVKKKIFFGKLALERSYLKKEAINCI